ncbi:MAG: hypothetical protein NTV42_06350 [Chloroflexi bacterium]|nr:hypothetical protein [Chloroflexota bacterium]
MIRALKAVLIVFGVTEILLGLMLVIFPDQAASMVGISKAAGYLLYTMASLGMCLIAPSVFLIVAARDPLRHINWVKFAILWCILGVLGGLYAVVQGAVTFNQVGMQIIMDAVFAVLFLALYPYRAAKGS